VESAGVLSLLLLMLAVVGIFIGIPFVSNYAFWFAIAAYFILDWGRNGLGMLSLLLLMLAVVGVFSRRTKGTACVEFAELTAFVSGMSAGRLLP
jgi:hypothetical protein